MTMIILLYTSSQFFISQNLAKNTLFYGVNHLDATTYVQWLCTCQFESLKNQSLTLTLVSAQLAMAAFLVEVLVHPS